MIIFIAAMTKARVIGKGGELPWKIPKELENFKRLTTGNTVVMGRKTYESILAYIGKPLPNRNNVVISTTMDNQLDIDVCGSVKHGILKAKTYGKDVFVIGGASIYKQALPLAEKMYISYIKEDYEGDAYFPKISTDEWEVERREDHQEFELVIYVRRKT